MDTVNQVDFAENIFRKLQDKTINVVGGWTLRCPFDEETEHETFQSFEDHARNMTEYGTTLGQTIRRC